MTNSKQTLMPKESLQDLVQSPDSKLFDDMTEIAAEVKEYNDNKKTENTETAYEKDLNYFWTWVSCFLYPKQYFTESYPVPHEFIIAYIKQHVIKTDPSIEQWLIESGYKQKKGLWSYKTMKRRLSSLQRAHNENVPGINHHYVFSNPEVKKTLKNTAKGKKHKQCTPLLREHIELMMDVTGNDKKSVMIRALICVAFASGGRRRSEMRHLKFGDIKKRKHNDWPGFSFTIQLSETKTEKETDKIPEVPVFDLAADSLNEWLEQCPYPSEGWVFRTPYKHFFSEKAIGEKWLGNILKELAIQANLEFSQEEMSKISAHSLRAGFATESALQGLQEHEAMELGLWKDSNVFRTYTRTENLDKNQAAHLLK